MAVIQISRIQHRRGLADDLPDALAEGEIGYATDTGEVFIGAPSNELVANRKAYPYQNIKILTEFDVQRSITGDVYYHGPLRALEVSKYSGATVIFDAPDSPNTNAITMVPLFKLSQASNGVYDYSFSELPDGYDGDATVQTGLNLIAGMFVVAGSTTESTIGLTATSSTNGGIDVVGGSQTDLEADDAYSAGKIALAIATYPDGADYQVYLYIFNRTPKALMFHYSGREWLAVRPSVV